MPQNIAELGLRIDANGAVTIVRALNSELERLGFQGDKSAQIMKLQEQELRKLAELSRSLGDYYGTQFQSLIRLNGGQERFLQIQRQIDQEMIEADALMQQFAASTDKAAQAATRKGVSINSLRSPLSTLSANLIGLNPQVSQLAGLFGSLALGSGVIVGVLGGIGAVSYAYDKLTGDTRKAREEQDKFVESLAKARAEELRATPEGKAQSVDEAAAALKRRREALANAKADASSRAFNPEDAGSIGLQADPAAQGRRVEEAERAVRQAEIELSRARVAAALERVKADQVSAQIVQDGIDRQKAWAEEAKRNDEKALQNLRERIALLDKYNAAHNLDLSGVTGNIDRNTPNIGFDPGGRQSIDPYRDEAAKKAGQAIVDRDKINVEHINNEAKARDASTKSLTGFQKAAQTASQALEYYLVSKIGGGGAGASLGAALGKGAFQDIASSFGKDAFINSAAGSAILGPLSAGIGAAVGGLADWALGLADAKKALVEFKEQMHANELASRIDAQGFKTLSQALEEVDIEERKRLRDLQDAGFSQDELDARRNQVYEDEALKRKRIRDEYAERERFSNEDLDVRALRAKGKNKEADALDLDNRQKAELAQAIAQGMSEEYLARLREIQAIEKTKAAMDEITKSAVNLVQGYRYSAAIFQNSPSRTFSGGGLDSGIIRPPINPFPNPSITSSTSAGDSVADVYLDGDKVGKVVLRDFQKKSQRKFGTTNRWSEIQ